MSAPALHADVWVIQNHDAVLLKHASAQQWHEQLRMPIDQFMGSATGLSSLACHDTVVLINLPKAEQSPETNHGGSEVWAGVEESPLRLTQRPATQAIHQLVHNIGLMGANLRCVHAPATGRFHSRRPHRRSKRQRRMFTEQHHAQPVQRAVSSQQQPCRAELKGKCVGTFAGAASVGQSTGRNRSKTG